MQIALKAVKQNKRPLYNKFRRKISKTDQKPPNLHKTQINYLKPSTPIRTSPNPIQYHNQTSQTRKIAKKLLLKAAREQKNFARSEKIFSHINFSLSQKQRYEQKTTLFSLRSSLLFSNQITPNFFTCFISRFKIHSNKID